MTTDDAPRPGLDAAAIEDARQLLEAVRASDRWFEYTTASARLSRWLTEHADALLAAAARADALAGEVARLRAALPSPCPEHGIDHMGLTRRWGWLNRPAADSVPVWACHHEGISGEPDCDFWHQITSEGYEALAPQEGDANGR